MPRREPIRRRRIGAFRRGRSGRPEIAVVGALLLGVATLACRATPTGFDLRAAAPSPAENGAARAISGLSLPAPPRAVEVTLGEERRAAIALPAGDWSWRGRVPPGARLELGVGASTETWQKTQTLALEVGLARGGRLTTLTTLRVDSPTSPVWEDLSLDLADFAGQDVELRFSARLTAADGGPVAGGEVLWAPVVFGHPAQEPPARPNIVFIVVDTLRFDHTTPYGYARDTTPNLQRLLAARGTVMEDARAQAPWTIPSVASFMTAVEPGEFLRDDVAAYGIPQALPTLTEKLRELGYETGGFCANPTLHDGNGFGRGFTTYSTAPATLDSMFLHADEVNRKALPWLQSAVLREPFFLYAHYIDPHDPYENPDMPGDRSPFDEPGVASPVTGRWVHGIWAGRLGLADRERDLRHLVALYDGEVRYADRFVGGLIEALPPAVAARTLFVFTSDHGEELLDHGGWKHGHALYEEQIHVPLVWRWDGHIAAGRRVQGAVRLLDVAPTLLAAAGGPAELGEGTSLLPTLLGGGAVPRLVVHSRHNHSGPQRAAVVVQDKKLILFNHRLPFAHADGLQDHLWRQDLGRLQRVELYDLVADPRERRNLAASDPREVARLQPLLDYQLDRELSGLHVVASGLPAGCRCRATVELAAPPAGWIPYFLADQDRVEFRGAVAELDLGGDVLAKGLLVTGAVPAVRRIAARLESDAGRSCPAPLRVLVGEGHPLPAGALEPALLSAAHWPEPGAGPVLRVWVRSPERPGEMRRDSETERRLRALGYIQ